VTDDQRHRREDAAAELDAAEVWDAIEDERNAPTIAAGDADQGRGASAVDPTDQGTRPGWAFWARFPHHEPDMED
jgi:hypothetical protein